jgi:hypothetical protein
LRWRLGDRLKIMLAFGGTVRYEDAVFDSGFELLRECARHCGFHAGNILTVAKHQSDRNGIGAGDQMPERQAVFIGLPFAKINDFDIGEFAWLAKCEQNRNGLRIAIRISGSPGAGVVAFDVDDFWREPAGEAENIDAGEQKRGGNEKPVSFGHMIFECGGRMICLITYQDARTE